MGRRLAPKPPADAGQHGLWHLGMADLQFLERLFAHHELNSDVVCHELETSGMLCRRKDRGDCGLRLPKWSDGMNHAVGPTCSWQELFLASGHECGIAADYANSASCCRIHVGCPVVASPSPKGSVLYLQAEHRGHRAVSKSSSVSGAK
ncbi:hypothetical protein K461DRAFT_89245 [Myriangium duriaei CBS 260.36]|uniref:Uncharacterized protein n=1 Tax=Myriangium duriaei CBS 260.36 TaxID=1168546 RepID=A0A9P4MK86_9PEZI|nr:hypothetical protein K461DRAFT_89245 [Myriangium duriaei CBS 260.36]